MLALILLAISIAFGGQSSGHQVSPGQLVVDQSQCPGCVEVWNMNTQDCVSVGFNGPDLFVTTALVLAGTGAGTGTWTKDGPDADTDLDFAPCLGPNQRAWTPLPAARVTVSSKAFSVGESFYWDNVMDVIPVVIYGAWQSNPSVVRRGDYWIPVGATRIPVIPRKCRDQVYDVRPGRTIIVGGPACN